MMSGALRSGDRGCSVGECRHGMIKGGAQAGTGSLLATSNWRGP